jgi:diaminohydroxyphosphoribosylaminopyrimidine deaminase/5-amino-6-(5-phosphoribosylamino)uracil reductase
MDSIDRKFMRLGLSLAKKAWGKTSPNPMVGAIIVKNGKVIGKGYHHRAGEAHAEVNAIKSAGKAAKGATIYVTLEPCSSYGRTPPCTEAIIKAGIKKVVIGSLDPNPSHAGKALKILSAQGIDVVHGIEGEKCLELNEAFFKWIKTGKPFVLLKMAMTLDGKIATSSGNSQWITGPVARKRVQKLRQWADAIMVGGETVRLDNPGLNVREPANWQPQPRRLVASNKFTLEALEKMMKPGITPEIINAKTPEEWAKVLTRLGKENVTSVLVEGGGELAGTLINTGIIDKVEFHIAPKILGGRDSRPVVGGANPESLEEAFGLGNLHIRKLGVDISVSGYINKPEK